MCKMVKKVVSGPHEDAPEYAGTEDYQWYETTILSRWEHPEKCQVLCIDTPFDLPKTLQRALRDRDEPPNFRDPFALHTDLWDQLIVYSDISVWRVRDPVRGLEKARLRPGEMFLPAHDFSRHAIHVSEVLGVAVETITAMDRCRTEIHRRLPDLYDDYISQAADYAQFQVSLLRSLKLRSDSNRARLETEITFVRPTSEPLPSSGVDYGLEWLTRSQAFNSLSRQDNHLVKSISLLTMIFLPAVFVSVRLGPSHAGF